MADPHRIDVHHHILPKRWLDEEAERMAGRAMDFNLVAQWTPAMSLEAMDRNGIATTITSISTVIVRPNEPDRAHGLARDCNEFAARLSQDHPKRFGMFALLPLPLVAKGLLPRVVVEVSGWTLAPPLPGVESKSVYR